MTDVAVVGAGIAGGAVGAVLAEAGLDVLILERTEVHKDVVRGEWLAPWGVLEARRLGLYELYLRLGGHHIGVHVAYDEDVAPDVAAEEGFDLASLLPDVPGPLSLGHPAACNGLNALACERGAQLIRGITGLRVTPGDPPQVTFRHRGDGRVIESTITPRLVIGADGRNGVVARQIGCTQHSDPEHHLFSGMLVEGATGWPDHLQATSTEGDVNVLVFPQGRERVRIYMGFASDQRTRLLGPQGQQRFLDAYHLRSIPCAEAIAEATPVSPCLVYPNSDAWVDHPIRNGVVLIGDAAGRNDPIIGQGLSITHRDVRLVRDALLGSDRWTPEVFEDYVAERSRRMHRLRTVARVIALRDSEFTPEARLRRAQIRERVARNPDLAAAFGAVFVGPDQVPEEAFADTAVESLMGGPIW